VIGHAEKVSDKLRTLLDLDFLIWLSKPTWQSLDKERQDALMHHELRHCRYDPDTRDCAIVAHDIEEFLAVIQAHGLWDLDLEHAARAIQPHLPSLERRGAVVAVDPAVLETSAA